MSRTEIILEDTHSADIDYFALFRADARNENISMQLDGAEVFILNLENAERLHDLLAQFLEDARSDPTPRAAHVGSIEHTRLENGKPGLELRAQGTGRVIACIDLAQAAEIWRVIGQVSND